LIKYKGGFACFWAVLVLILFWQLAASGLKEPYLPAPYLAFQAFALAITKELARHFLISSYRVVLSLIISLLLAVPLGLVLGREALLDKFLSPLIFVVYPIPKIVFLPIFMSFFGLGNLSKILLITLVVFFQILVTTRDAARSVDNRLIDSVTSLGAGKLDIYLHVIFPACLPDILTSLRIGLGTAIAVLFISESIASSEGIGYYLMDAWSRVAYDEMFSGVIAMGILGLILYFILERLEKLFCPWRFI
jgi:NitT/TauT family transport system permease protein